MCSWVLSLISETPGAPLEILPCVGSGSLPLRHDLHWVLAEQKVQVREPGVAKVI